MTKQNNEGSNSKIEPENRIAMTKSLSVNPIDDAIIKFSLYARGLNNFDELDFKEAISNHYRSLVKEMMDKVIDTTVLPKGVDATCAKLLGDEQRKSRDELLDQYFGKEVK